MFLTFTDHYVHFKYGSKGWQYSYGDIALLGMLRQKRTYFIEKAATLVFSAALYYYLFFTGMDYLLFVIPLASCFITAAVIRYRTAPEFEYYVIVKDRSGAAVKIKIRICDKKTLCAELAHYDSLKFQKAAGGK